ncbi:MAG TPA: sulfatase-like hydrolase/transferase, partial [Lacipirellulaceae bacterium]|nr:sulfatase-like hydrolase/transferase [Lacipirellulaceae bacterium]
MLATTTTGSLAQAQPAQPNIVLIIADDLGFNEVGFNSALHGWTTQFQTPHLDALAAQSVVARQGYAAGPLCGIARAGLLTGRYPQHVGVEENLGNNIAQTFGFKAGQQTMATRLKELGYRTGMVGKWHEGFVQGVNRPNDQGFDEFFGFLGGARQYYGDVPLSNVMMRNNTYYENQWRTEGNPALYDPTRGRYVTDAFGEESVDFINR